MHSLDEDPKVVGSKQTLRALEKGQAKMVFIAKDTAPPLKTKLVNSAKEHEVEIVYFDTMKELGEACSVAVKTAVAAIIS